MLAEVSFEKDANSAWGFRLTGGPQFEMPLTVFEVEEGGKAYKAGIRLGDVLVRINGMEADRLSLEEAHNMIREAGSNINLSISNLEDQELRENEEFVKSLASASEAEDTEDELSREVPRSDRSEPDTSELVHSVASDLDTSEIQHSAASESEGPQTETSVSLARSDAEYSDVEPASEPSNMSKSSVSKDSVRRESIESKVLMKTVDDVEESFVDVNLLPLLPPRPAPEPEKAVRKCWHPVMLDTNPPPIIEESTGDEEYPHKKTIRNIRKLIAEKKVTPTPETLIFFLCNKFAVSEERANKISA